jgi:predicted metal-binding protein
MLSHVYPTWVVLNAATHCIFQTMLHVIGFVVCAQCFGILVQLMDSWLQALSFFF